MEESLVHTAEGQEVKLTCTVHCSPKCEVSSTADNVERETKPNSQKFIMISFCMISQGIAQKSLILCFAN
jgi:hypothetical protein